MKAQFYNIVAALVRAKETWYLLTVLRDNFAICSGGHNLVAAVLEKKTRFEKDIAAIAKNLGNDVAADIDDVINALKNERIFGVAVKDCFKEIKDNGSAANKPFFSEYGVSLETCLMPACMKTVLDAVCAAIASNKEVIGFVGEALKNASALKAGCAGVVLHDVNDYTIIFEDPDSANDFLFSYAPNNSSLVYLEEDEGDDRQWVGHNGAPVRTGG